MVLLLLLKCMVSISAHYRFAPSWRTEYFSGFVISSCSVVAVWFYLIESNFAEPVWFCHLWFHWSLLCTFKVIMPSCLLQLIWSQNLRILIFFIFFFQFELGNLCYVLVFIFFWRGRTLCAHCNAFSWIGSQFKWTQP